MPGVNKLLQQMPESSQVLFTLLLPEFGSYSKPTLCVYHRMFPLNEVKANMELAFQQFQKEAIQRHTDRMGEGHFYGWK